jgi:hypothetical protein
MDRVVQGAIDEDRQEHHEQEAYAHVQT